MERRTGRRGGLIHLLALIPLLILVACDLADISQDDAAQTSDADDAALSEVTPAQLWFSHDENPFDWEETYMGNRVRLTLDEFGGNFDSISVDSSDGSGVLKHAFVIGSGWMPSIYCYFDEGYWDADNYPRAKQLEDAKSVEVTLTGRVREEPDVKITLTGCEVNGIR